jgi:hypothetical protein
MVYFQTKKPNLGKLCKPLQRLENVAVFHDHLKYFTEICEDHLKHFVFIWKIFFGFGIIYPEKSGNPAAWL